MSSLEPPVQAAEPAPEPIAGVARAPRRSSSSSSGRVLRLMEANALLVLLVLTAIFFSVWSKTGDTFLSSANLQILFSNQAVTAIIALGALIPLVCNEFDLSVGAIAGLAAVLVASALSGGLPVPIAILYGVGIGTAAGVVNCLLVTRAGVNGVIATLGMATILDGVVTQKTGGQAVVADIPKAFTDFGTGNTFGIPRVAYAMVAVALLVYYLLAHTPLGRQIYALGSNRAAAALVGMRTRLVLGVTFIAAGALSGAAGVLYVARAGGADPNVGAGFTLPALAAAFLSAASVKPGRYNVGGALVAIFFLAVLNNGLNLAGAQPYVSNYVNGIALILGVGLAAYLHRRRSGTSSAAM
ncbi:MAG: inner-rane translocator [Conexibacter sp.]|nr:inner-rane translocator [Conexibacter sp.]